MMLLTTYDSILKCHRYLTILHPLSLRIQLHTDVLVHIWFLSLHLFPPGKVTEDCDLSLFSF